MPGLIHGSEWRGYKWHRKRALFLTNLRRNPSRNNESGYGPNILGFSMAIDVVAAKEA